MSQVVQMQSFHCSDLDKRKLCSFDREVISAPTKPLLHQAARFLLINRGQGRIRIQQTEYQLRPGALVAILPWALSEVVQVDIPLQYYLVVYQFDIVSQLLKSFYNAGAEELYITRQSLQGPVVYSSGEELETVRRCFHTIRDEVGTESAPLEAPPLALGSVYVTTKLVELAVLFERLSREQAAGGADQERNADRSEIFRYIYSHLSEKLTLTMLSQLFYLSESAISHYITQMTGLSFFDLLNEMRVGRMINYLLYTDFTLEELAEILGYVDASHISKVFAARMGTRANDYRKTYQRMNDLCRIKESRKAYGVVSRVYRGYAEALTARGVAEEFGMSVPELHRTLLYQVERSFDDFLNLVRINRACELLVNTRMPLADITAEVGYNNIKTFSRNFLQLRLMTPGAFRRAAAPGDRQ